VMAPPATPACRRRRGRAGFTLIEMVVVVMIIGLGSALVVPLIQGGWESREVRRAARQIASTMHYCRGRALELHEPQALVIDAQKNQVYTSLWDRWAVLTDKAVILRIDGGNVLAEGVVQILFFPNGSTSGADVMLANRRDRSRTRLTVHLEPLIGSVRVGDTEG
jgi:general secretion pathway protein H